jgi:hypothetical protein
MFLLTHMIFYYILLYVNIELLIYGNIFLFDVKKYVSNTHILIFFALQKKNYSTCSDAS